MSEPSRRYSIPLFPLDNVVLYPRVSVPLHLFEPRYRTMAADAIDADRRIGMVAVRPEHVENMAGNPPVFEIGCVGWIEQHERLPDGRYNIVLHGRQRFRICEELPIDEDRLYRMAIVESLPDLDPPEDQERVALLRVEVFDKMREFLRREAPQQLEAFNDELFRDVDNETFANVIAHSFRLVSIEKQALLEADSVRERLERLAGLLHFRLAERGGRGFSDPGVVH